MEKASQVVKPLPVQPVEPDGEAADVGFGRHRAVSTGGPMVVVILSAGVQEPEAFDVFGIAGPEIAFLGITLAASPIEVAVFILEV